MRARPPRAFRMREKLLAIGDDYWIEDDAATRSSRSTARPSGCGTPSSSRTASGNELAKIQEKKLSVRDKMTIERGRTERDRAQGAASASATATSSTSDDGEDLKAHGNIVDHEYEIERDGDTVAKVSKKWFRVRDTYGVEIWPRPGRPARPRHHGVRRRTMARG